MSKFFDFRQNNSGGKFHTDAKRGIGISVIIEAEDWRDANDRAEDIGLYFNGCEDDRDCSCCGDRWYSQSDYDKGDDVPSVYGQDVSSGTYTNSMSWSWGSSYIHYLDGRIVEVTGT